MSTAPQTPSAQPALPASPAKHEIRIISHSTLFYWWPVWAVGFLMSLITAFSGEVMAVVPNGTTPQTGVTLPNLEGPRDILVTPDKKHLPVDAKTKNPLVPKLHVAN